MKSAIIKVFVSGILSVFFALNSYSVTKQDSLLDLKDTKVLVIDGTQLSQYESDSIKKEAEKFYYDQFRHFDDPLAPNFMLMSRDNKISLGIGGKVKLVGWYEWGGAVPSKGLAPSLIPIPENPLATRHLGLNIGGTGLFFRVIGQNATLGKYTVYIEGGFSGYNDRDFKLKKAYSTFRDITIGLTTSTFSDPSTIAPDVDAQGVTSEFDLTRILIRYMPQIKNNYTLAVSAEYPSKTKLKKNKYVDATEIWLPDFAAFAQYSWNKSSHVRLSGIMRTMGYRDYVSNRNHNVIGWGTQLSAVSKMNPLVTLYGQVNCGKGVAGLVNDLSAGNIDLVSSSKSNPEELYAPFSWGWNAGIKYSFTKRMFCSIQGSQSRYLPKHYENPTNHKYGLYGAVNMFYNVTPRMLLGTQFTWGERHNFNGQHKAARRIEATAMYSF